MQHIRDEHGERVNRDRMTVGRAIQQAALHAGGDEAQALADVGIAVKDRDGKKYLVVAARHSALSKLFQGTRWKSDGAWSGGLREIDGSIKSIPARLSSCLIKCTFVPFSALGIDIGNDLIDGKDKKDKKMVDVDVFNDSADALMQDFEAEIERHTIQ
jgi:hypothetical protein